MFNKAPIAPTQSSETSTPSTTLAVPPRTAWTSTAPNPRTPRSMARRLPTTPTPSPSPPRPLPRRGFLTRTPSMRPSPSRRWSSNPSGKCSCQQPTQGTFCGTMHSMCGADAGCLAINYQSLRVPERMGPRGGGRDPAGVCRRRPRRGHRDGGGATTDPGVFTAALEATQGQILNQSPTDATRFWWHLYGR